MQEATFMWHRTVLFKIFNSSMYSAKTLDYFIKIMTKVQILRSIDDLFGLMV